MPCIIKVSCLVYEMDTQHSHCYCMETQYFHHCFVWACDATPCVLDFDPAMNYFMYVEGGSIFIHFECALMTYTEDTQH